MTSDKKEPQQSSPEPVLAKRGEIRALEDLLAITDRSMQEIVKSVRLDVWSVALKEAPKDLADFVLGNMSLRAAERLADEISRLAPTAVEIDTARGKILAVSRELIDEGRIIFGSHIDHPLERSNKASPEAATRDKDEIF